MKLALLLIACLAATANAQQVEIAGQRFQLSRESETTWGYHRGNVRVVVSLGPIIGYDIRNERVVPILAPGEPKVVGMSMRIGQLWHADWRPRQYRGGPVDFGISIQDPNSLLPSPRVRGIFRP